MAARDNLTNDATRGDASRRILHRRSVPIPGAQLDGLLLDVLERAERPLSAYDLAAELHKKGRGMSVPPIYRALDRLIGRRLVQRVETLSAYRVRDTSTGVLMICLDCQQTVSVAVPDEYAALALRVRQQGFDPVEMTIETIGRCTACREPGPIGGSHR